MSCPVSIGLCRLRVTRLDAEGNVAPEPDNYYVTADPIQLQLTPEVETGEERTLKNGCGGIIASRRDPDRFKRWGLELDLGKIEPALKEILLGVDLVEDGGTPIGINGVSQISSDFEPSKCAVEAWANAEVDDAPDPDGAYIYFCWPASYWNFGQNTIGDDYLQPKLVGFSQSNPLWGTGPYDDLGVAFSVQHWAIVQVPDAPPDAACGYGSIAPGS